MENSRILLNIFLLPLLVIVYAKGECTFANYVAKCQHFMGGQHMVDVQMTIHNCDSPVSLSLVLQGHINSTKQVWKQNFINAEEIHNIAGFGANIKIKVTLTRYADSNKLHLKVVFYVNDAKEDFVSAFVNLGQENCSKQNGKGDTDTGLVVLIVVLSVTAVLGILAGTYIFYLRRNVATRNNKAVRDKRNLMNSVESSLNTRDKKGKKSGCAAACGGSDSSTGYDNSMTMSSKSGSHDHKDGVVMTVPNGHVTPVNAMMGGLPYGGVYTGENPHSFGPPTLAHSKGHSMPSGVLNGQQVEVELSDIYRNHLPQHAHSSYNDSLRLAQVSSDSENGSKHKSGHNSKADLRRNAIERSMYVHHQESTTVQEEENSYKEYWIDSNDEQNTKGQNNTDYKGDVTDSGQILPNNNQQVVYGSSRDVQHQEMVSEKLNPYQQHLHNKNQRLDHSLHNPQTNRLESAGYAYHMPHSNMSENIAPQVPPKTAAARQTPEGSSGSQELKNTIREDTRHSQDHFMSNNSMKNKEPNSHHSQHPNDYTQQNTYDMSRSFYSKDEALRNGQVSLSNGYNGHSPSKGTHVSNGYVHREGLSPPKDIMYLQNQEYSDNMQSSMV